MFKHIVAKKRIEYIIRKNKFHHVYQPLYVLDNWCIFGYEALIRCDLQPNPEILFRTAIEGKKLFQFDIASIMKAIITYKSSRYSESNANLFINVFSSTLLHPSFYAFLDQLLLQNEVIRNHVVFEIVESEEIYDYRPIREITFYLRDRGFRIAIDDFGKGYSSIEKVLELEPDFIKLDRFFSRNLSYSSNKQKLLSLLVDYCNNKTRLILEGIETPEDLATAKFLGVHIGQGNILGKADVLQNLGFATRRWTTM
jgi:EAL domain-containing protein (putative c-di-GMP-specific phosphodiesterase class I)